MNIKSLIIHHCRGWISASVGEWAYCIDCALSQDCRSKEVKKGSPIIFCYICSRAHVDKTLSECECDSHEPRWHDDCGGGTCSNCKRFTSSFTLPDRICDSCQYRRSRRTEGYAYNVEKESGGSTISYCFVHTTYTAPYIYKWCVPNE